MTDIDSLGLGFVLFVVLFGFAVGSPMARFVPEEKRQAKL